MISVSIKIVNQLTANLRKVWNDVYAIFSNSHYIVFSDGNKKIFRIRS